MPNTLDNRISIVILFNILSVILTGISTFVTNSDTGWYFHNSMKHTTWFVLIVSLLLSIYGMYLDSSLKKFRRQKLITILSFLSLLKLQIDFLLIGLSFTYYNDDLFKIVTVLYEDTFGTYDTSKMIFIIFILGLIVHIALMIRSLIYINKGYLQKDSKGLFPTKMSKSFIMLCVSIFGIVLFYTGISAFLEDTFGIYLPLSNEFALVFFIAVALMVMISIALACSEYFVFIVYQFKFNYEESIPKNFKETKWSQVMKVFIRTFIKRFIAGLKIAGIFVLIVVAVNIIGYFLK